MLLKPLNDDWVVRDPRGKKIPIEKPVRQEFFTKYMSDEHKVIKIKF
jgi:hypothetical protein